jgi:hypothetical protein
LSGRILNILANNNFDFDLNILSGQWWPDLLKRGYPAVLDIQER